jgi:hypothetical protein
LHRTRLTNNLCYLSFCSLYLLCSSSEVLARRYNIRHHSVSFCSGVETLCFTSVTCLPEFHLYSVRVFSLFQTLSLKFIFLLQTLSLHLLKKHTTHSLNLFCSTKHDNIKFRLRSSGMRPGRPGVA